MQPVVAERSAVVARSCIPDQNGIGRRSPTGETRRNHLLAKRAAKEVRKRIAIDNKLAKLTKHGRIAQLSFRREK